jgi:hypothetical protein
MGIDESLAFVFYSKREQEITSKRQNKLTQQETKLNTRNYHIHHSQFPITAEHELFENSSLFRCDAMLVNDYLCFILKFHTVTLPFPTHYPSTNAENFWINFYEFEADI